VESDGSTGHGKIVRFVRGLPPWVQALGAVFTILTFFGIGAAVHENSKGSTTITHSSTVPPTPPHRLKARYLDRSQPTDSTPGESTTFGTGLARISGAPFPHSVRHIYGVSCCSAEASETYAIPDGYKRFTAWVGLETGGDYDPNHSPTVTFEVDVGNATNTAFTKTVGYGDEALRVNVPIPGHRVLVLKTATHDDNCFTCEADAVWGTAKLLP
jgi:hypothetical protein